MLATLWAAEAAIVSIRASQLPFDTIKRIHSIAYKSRDIKNKNHFIPNAADLVLREEPATGLRSIVVYPGVRSSRRRIRINFG